MRTVWMLLSALFVGIVHADTLLLETIENAPPNSLSALPRPTLGMTKVAVEGHYGAPELRIPAVGDPPISRWVYDPYTVYFEREHVIRSVVHY